MDLEDITKIMANSRDPKQLLDVWTRLAHHLAAHAQGFHALRRTREQGRAGTRASRTPARCGGPSTTCRPTRLPRSSTGCGSRCGRSTSRCTPTCAAGCAKNTANVVPANGPDSRRTCWATCGRRSGPTSIRWWRPKDADPGYDLTQILKARKTDRMQMVQYGEGFFTSLGFAPLPETFWKRSLFVKPRDREVVCHASAWDVDNVNDLRIKMCIDITDEDFTTIHHELGPQLLPARLQHSSRSCSATAPTTASTKPSATPSRSPSRPSIW